jgi:hypothetical protein
VLENFTKRNKPFQERSSFQNIVEAAAKYDQFWPEQI